MKSLFIVGLSGILIAAAPAWAEEPASPTMIKNGMGPVISLRFSPDGRELARICQFGPVALFDLTDLNRRRTFSVGMRAVAYSPDGSWIATAEGTDGARIWDASSAGKLMPSPNPSMLDKFYLLETPLQVLQAPSRDAGQRVFEAEFSPNGKYLMTAHASGHVKVWRTDSWKEEDDLVLSDGDVRAAAFAPDNEIFAAGDAKGVLHFFRIGGKKEFKTTTMPLGAITSLAFAPDGKLLVMTHLSNSDYGAVIWNLSTWEAEKREGMGSAVFSKTGDTLALGGSHIELIDPLTRKLLRTIELPEVTLAESNRLMAQRPNANAKIPIFVSALAFSPDGKTLAAGCKDGTVRLVKIDP